ncbi:hypothetical protein Cme02nite_33970 [Catellatospora methionotrophica]|uniref:Uncharacterized protein n=2 Tax=Catellatospora methionotrophica TaxID=121620 RepID=A0A8J3LA92_9ACTN|nr:hypothetical protein Cme02nite_33970 [Catellatospora methionotrophica]
MYMADVPGIASTIAAVVLPLLLVSTARKVFSRPPGCLELVVLAVWTAFNIWQAHWASTPTWATVLNYVAVAAVFVLGVRAMARYARASRPQPIDPAELQRFIEHVTADDAFPVVVFGVSPTGAIAFSFGPASDQTAMIELTSGCPLSFVQGRIDAMLGPQSPLITQWREGLAENINHRVVLSRDTQHGSWTGKLKQHNGPAYDERTCPYHGDHP